MVINKVCFRSHFTSPQEVYDAMLFFPTGMLTASTTLLYLREDTMTADVKMGSER